MIKNILVATDASAASNRAIKMASRIATIYDADLLIVHVIRDMQLPPDIKEVPELDAFNFESFINTRENILRKVAESVLRDSSDKAKKAGARNVQTAIGTGDPATSILGFAKRRKMDMVVVGTRGLGKLKGAVMGSVSRKVANSAEANCLIVR